MIAATLAALGASGMALSAVALPHDVPAGACEGEPDVAVVDYVAGMTDRFARREYERIST